VTLLRRFAPNPRSARLADRWLGLLCLTLVGYALSGKGWAYLGLPPVFIGELVLVTGIAALLAVPRWHQVLDLPPVWALLALSLWGGVRTLPYVSVHGADAVRDAAIWGYGVFAVVVAGLILAEPSRLGVLLDRYGRFIPVFLLALPALWVVTRLVELPRWPWVDVPVIRVKGGDALVHLAGALAFWASGLGGRVRLGWIALMGGCLLMIGVVSRGGLLTFLAIFALCICFRPRNVPAWRLAGVLVIGLFLAAATSIRIDLHDRQRPVSFDQFVASLTSTVFESGRQGLDGTKSWRLSWWGDIVDYTLNGRYFWTGKGFGINLADDDGYQGDAWDGRLRSPHNGHLTMLARAGVPGLALWLLVHGSWAVGMIHRYYQAKAAREARWAAAFLFLFCYWLAFMVNASFDVFIEGPVGGIWLWTIYGLGLAAMWSYRHEPEALEWAWPVAPPMQPVAPAGGRDEGDGARR
jgi:hypothetical protein